MNQLYHGDNLYVLRDHIAIESVDLIYLAPPFNSKRDDKDCPRYGRDRGRARNADTNTRETLRNAGYEATVVNWK